MSRDSSPTARPTGTAITEDGLWQFMLEQGRIGKGRSTRQATAQHVEVTIGHSAICDDKVAEAYAHWCVALRQRRVANELTQQEVAKAIGLLRSHYTSLESGKTVINFAHLYALAKVFGVSMSTLLADPDEKPRRRGGTRNKA
jgi:DNA-binding XRE family transcriptional regulator